MRHFLRKIVCFVIGHSFNGTKTKIIDETPGTLKMNNHFKCAICGACKIVRGTYYKLDGVFIDE